MVIRATADLGMGDNCGVNVFLSAGTVCINGSCGVSFKSVLCIESLLLCEPALFAKDKVKSVFFKNILNLFYNLKEHLRQL